MSATPEQKEEICQLFRKHVPEIADGTVEIVSVARNVGHRTYVAVRSHAPWYPMSGGKIVPEQRYSEFVDGREVIFRPINARHYRDYLGSAAWFYRKHPVAFPALQCIWPDKAGAFPHEPKFDERFRPLQTDLSL